MGKARDAERAKKHSKDFRKKDKKEVKVQKEESENEIENADYSVDEDVCTDNEGNNEMSDMDSEEMAMKKDEDAQKASRKSGKVQDRDSKKNKLNLGQFHRNATFKQKNRKVTTKKQIRDIERTLDRTGLPEEVRKAKKAELMILKKEAKKKREAELFSTKYEKIKFTEKRKVIRQMEATKKGFKDQSLSEEARSGLQTKLKTLKDQLTYVNHFPTTQKYISLFPKNDDETSKKRRTEAMGKILKIASVKQNIRERDLKEEIDTDGKGGKTKDHDDKVFGTDKEVQELDPFFVNAGEGERVDKPHEKREVMRDGRVPKFQKNVEKMEQRQIEAQTRREGWIAKKEEKIREVQKEKAQYRPLKFNAATFGTGQAQIKATGAAPATATHNIKF